jgi:hypothetical protein
LTRTAAAVLSVALISVATIAEAAAQEFAGAVPVPAVDDRVPVRFIHVDVDDGQPGMLLASTIRSLVQDSETLRADDASTMVVWLRTLTVAFPAPLRPGDFRGATGVAYSIVVDLKGRHVTDTLGFASSDSVVESAERIVANVDELALELTRAEAVASF